MNDIRQSLEGFGLRDVATAIRIIRSIEKRGGSVSDLVAYEEENSTSRHQQIVESDKQRKTTKGRRKARKEAKRNRNQKVKPPFLRPGESEMLPGLKCAKCGGGIVSEALCGKTAQKKGCIRIGLCMECDAQIRIK